MNSKDILIQETEFDSMFNDINEMLNEVFEDDPDFLEANYGFQVEWDDITENEEVEEIEGLKLDLIENFYSIRNEAKWQRDDILPNGMLDYVWEKAGKTMLDWGYGPEGHTTNLLWR